MQDKKYAGIWIRVSTEDQAKGDSPQHHEYRARQYAEARGWEVKTVYHLEALSGKSIMDSGAARSIAPPSRALGVPIERSEMSYPQYVTAVVANRHERG